MAEINIVDKVWSESDNTFGFSRPEWFGYAACRGKTELFFTDNTANEAKRICRRCPVLQECKQFIQNKIEVGVWAGQTATERRTQKR